MICIKTVFYSFIQQGTVFGEVRPQRGIRQGDPISSYLYILCVEGLSFIIKRNEEVGLLHGCSIARRAPAVSYLLFADDCYFFFKGFESEARMMWRIIKKYETLSGQAVNLINPRSLLVLIQLQILVRLFVVFWKSKRVQLGEST